MSKEVTSNFVKLFLSRLTTLGYILDISEQHFQGEAESILDFRLVDDMAPFATQIIYTCKQPNDFLSWYKGQNSENQSPEIKSLAMARDLIEQTKSQLKELELEDTKLSELKRIEIGGGQYLEFDGVNYVQEFLIPNFYFHLTTAYNIMRMKGVPLGKSNFLSHVGPFVKTA